MKKIKYIVTTLFFILSFIYPLNISASEINQSSTSTVLYNGDVIIEKMYVEQSARSNTKKGTKTIEYKNSAGKVLWKATLSASFTYTGNSSKCTSSSISAVSYANTWKIVNKSATKSNNLATGKIQVKQYFNTTPIETINRTISIKCTSKGVLS